MPNNKVMSKADVLTRLKPKLKTASIEDIYVFTVEDWKNRSTNILQSLRKRFLPKHVVVRSSSCYEDMEKDSMAGCFYTELNVNSKNPQSLSKAVENVINSYKDRGGSKNQIVVQTQTKSVLVSGVVFTRALGTNSPYYVINYDDTSGKTTTVTGGRCGSMVCIFRSANLPKNNRWHKLLKAIGEIEEHFSGKALDIEFAIKKDEKIVIFQVRPLTANRKLPIPDQAHIKGLIDSMKAKFNRYTKRVPHLAGKRTIFGDMPDWNPAEMIGNRPNTLDYTLYSFLITDYIWHEARSTLGYKDVYPAELMTSFGKRPYIDTRASFNSFIPADLPDKIREKLVNFYLDKLESHPEKQDKVEFEIVHSCYNFSLDKQLNELKQHGFTSKETTKVKTSLLALTNKILRDANSETENIFSRDIKLISRLEARRADILAAYNDSAKNQSPWTLFTTAYNLLQNCKKFGVLPFSRLARLAFIGKNILVSLRDEDVISNSSYHNFLNSINTIATAFSKDLSDLSNGKSSEDVFYDRYGHLRPGTYDITAPRYDSMQSIFKSGNKNFDNIHASPSFSKKAIDKIMKLHKLCGDSYTLITFIKEAIRLREEAKLKFTRTLSEALEIIAEAGKKLGFSRDELSHADLNTLLKFRNPEFADEKHAKSIITQSIMRHKKEKEWSDLLILPPVILSDKDFEFVSFYKARPNFITMKVVQAPALVYDRDKFLKAKTLNKFIVLLENADPGYDWIFTKEPLGIITKYGGVASHMAIRCAEFGIPAAIGCGSTIYDNLLKSKIVLIDCAKQVIEPLEI